MYIFFYSKATGPKANSFMYTIILIFHYIIYKTRQYIYIIIFLKYRTR